MSTDLVPAVLPRLLDKARQLNAASDQANTILASVEAKLNDAKIGVTFWFEDQPLHQSDAIGDGGLYSLREHTDDYLGYARIDGKWCLAVKRIKHTSGFFEGSTSCPFTESRLVSEPTALLKSARETRLAALRILQVFLERFTEKVSEVLGEIQSAADGLYF